MPVQSEDRAKIDPRQGKESEVKDERDWRGQIKDIQL